MRFKWRYIIAALVVAIGVPGGYFAWYLGSPLLFDKTVDEEFPFAFASSAELPEGTTRQEAEKVMSEAAAVDVSVSEDMPDLAGLAVEPTPDLFGNPEPELGIPDLGETGESGPSAGPGPTETPAPGTPTPTPASGQLDPDAPTPTPPATPDADDATPTPSPPSTPTPTPKLPSAPTEAPATPAPAPESEAVAVAVALSTGSFRDADRFHNGEGTATVYRGPDGSLLLRFEDFKVTNGPDLHVIVSPHPDPQNQAQLKTEGYVDLGKLKGNVGNQNYFFPDGFDADLIGSIVIYCQPFHVIFSVAPLTES